MQATMPPTCQRILAIAERNPRRAVGFVQRCLTVYEPNRSPDFSWFAYTYGWALLQWERFDQARPQLAAARQAFATDGHGLTALRCDYALLLADLFQYARPDLEQELAALAGQFELAGAPEDAARTLLCQATLLVILGRALDAETVLDRIAPVLTQGQPADLARWLYICGSAAIIRGNSSHASALLAQAEQAFAALHSPLERAKCWLQLAWVALRQERLEQALTGYRRAEQMFARLDLPLRLAICNKGIGLLLTRMGKYDDALRSLLRALRSFTALQRTSDIGTCQLNLGNIYFYTGQWDIALAYYSRAEVLYTAAGVVGEQITAQRNRAMIYRIQGRSAEAYALLAKVESEAQAIGDQSEVAEIWSEQAGLLSDAGHYEDAVFRYQQARDLFVHLSNHLDAAECDVEQGWLALRHGEGDTAYASFYAAAPLVAPHPYYWWRTAYGLARCAEACEDATTALSHYRSASDTVAELRRRLASEVTSSSLYIQAAQLYIDSLRFTAMQGALTDLLTFSELQRALSLQRAFSIPPIAQAVDHQAEIEALQLQIAVMLAEKREVSDQHEQALDAALANYGDLLLRARHSTVATSNLLDDILPTTFDLEQFRALLNRSYRADWTAVVYILVDDTLLIGVVTPEDLALVQTPYDETLQRLIARASQPAYQLYTYRDLPYHQGRTTRPWEDLHALANRLLPATVQARLHPEHRLLIVPAGALHAMPWAALRTEAGWLAEQAIIHLAPSLTIWQSLAARTTTHHTSALLIGCSTFGDRAAALPEVAAELTSVAAHWPGDCLILTDEQATRANLLERSRSGALARYGLLHIASHAQLLPDRGLAAHVKLKDSDLWLAEVAGLHLGGALVALSACDGAAANPLPGEEVLSLSWAFLAAGASGVLASLWPVDDLAARHFMAVFYDALREHGDAGLALAYAQRTLILRYSRDNDALAEPLCWGSFVLTGGSHLLW
jgi:CHAT domain-containing protein/tetratricopeptide (TPR) repeat protein